MEDPILERIEARAQWLADLGAKERDVMEKDDGKGQYIIIETNSDFVPIYLPEELQSQH